MLKYRCDICLSPSPQAPQFILSLKEMTLLSIWVLLSSVLGSHSGLKWSQPMFVLGTCEGLLLGSITEEQRN